MADIRKVKEEPNDVFEDPLETLASAATEHDSLSLFQKLLNGRVADSTQLPAAGTAPLLPPTKRESEWPDVSSSTPGSSTDSWIPEAQWYDVGIFRERSCTVRDFYLSETAINHRADTSDNLPDYRGLGKMALLPGVAYKFRVAAINSLGIGEFSDVSAFKTCVPGYPGAPGSIRVSKSGDGVILRWQPPLIRYGEILEYSVCLGVKTDVLRHEDATAPLRKLTFMRVYCGVENCAFVENSSLQAAHIDRSSTPAIQFRIAARNAKGYGPAIQIRWVDDFDGARTCNVAKKRPYSQV